MTSFKEILLQISDEFEISLENICFSISMNEFDFPFSFFAFEDENFLGIYSTMDDGAEKLHVLVKSKIVYFRIHYLDEIDDLFNFEDVKKNHEIHNYE